MDIAVNYSKIKVGWNYQDAVCSPRRVSRVGRCQISVKSLQEASGYVQFHVGTLDKKV